MKPTFMIIGSAKSGTTTLCHLLGQHPELFMSSPKELHFFSFDEIYARGLDWYESWFEEANGSKQAGEGSQSYTVCRVWPETARRIAEYAPEIKLIYIARHPLDRMVSLWLQIRYWGTEYPWRHAGTIEIPQDLRVDSSLDKAIRLQAHALVDSSNYWQEINVYRNRFPDEQILVLFFEDLMRDPQAVLARCFDFLGVDREATIGCSGVHLNPSSEHQFTHDILWRLWSSPHRRRAYRAVANLFPRPLRRVVGRHLLRSPMTERPQLDRETRQWALDRLGDDVRNFLEHYGKPRDYWRFEEDG